MFYAVQHDYQIQISNKNFVIIDDLSYFIVNISDIFDNERDMRIYGDDIILLTNITRNCAILCEMCEMCEQT